MSMDKQNVSWPGWETVRLIGRGSFGAVYEIQRDIFGDIEKAALKVISIPQNAGDIDEMYSDGYDEESITSTFKSHLKSIVAEYSLMRKMNGCANIVNCDDVRYIQHDDGIGWDIFIKMELLTSLTKALPAQASEETVINIAKDICKALELCKKHEIVHRDIKPQNIFVSPNGDYKLGDFGIAKTVEKTMGGTKIGTYKYMAPEVYNNKPYGSAADIYSLGLVLYWLLNERRMPFLPLPPAKLSAGMDEQARNRRLSGEQFAEPKNGSEKLKAVVMKACAYSVEDRYASASEMLMDLNQIGQERSPQTNAVSAVSVPSTAPVNRIEPEDEDKTVGVFGKAASENVVISDAQLEEGTVGLFFKPAIEPALTNSAADVDSFVEMKDTTNVQIEKESGDVSAIDEEFERKESTGKVAEPEKCSTMIPDEKDSSVDQSTNQKSRKSPIAFIMLCVGMIAVLLAVFYFFIHFWTPATCTEPSNCKICGKIGEAATGHNWKAATCTEPSTCKICGKIGEVAKGHSWKPATCTEPSTCNTCGKTGEAALGHDWALSAACSGLECSRCDYATQVLEITDFELGQGYNDAAGFGLNNNGRPVYWIIYIELLNIQAYDVYSVVCSWDDSVISVNGKTGVNDIYHDYGWETANSGQTLWESYPNYEQRQFVRIMLPDDKTIEGPQWVAVIGRKGDVVYSRIINFTLTYNGSYRTGTGWSATNINWS